MFVKTQPFSKNNSLFGQAPRLPNLVTDTLKRVCKYIVNCLSESRIFADETDFADFFIDGTEGCLNQDLQNFRIFRIVRTLCLMTPDPIPDVSVSS